MIAVLAEKPGVARELAKLLVAEERKEGYWEGNGYTVTWALGHLVTLGLPEDYGIRGFQKENLPLLPAPFLLTPRKGSGKEHLLPEKGTLKQLLVIGELFKQCKSIIVATDAGREGELIFRYIYEYLNCRKPFNRLWVSSLTQKALKQGLNNLLPGNTFDGLYHAARARSRADWLVGINASQALTLAAGSGVYSLGRVQTPTLALICKRYEQHRSFVPEKYWQLQLQHTRSFTDFSSTAALRWSDKIQAEDAQRSVQRKGEGIITDVRSRIVTDTAPLLFDLTGLQKAANRKLGLTARETLEAAQSLYEKQFITYPRTGSRYITEDLWTGIPRLIRGMEADTVLGKALSKIRPGRLNRHIVNEAKVTDHHGLLITEKTPSALSVRENAVYRMIALRMLEAVSENCMREIIDTTLQVLHYDFTISSCNVLEPGWRAVQGQFEAGEEVLGGVPELKTGDRLVIGGATVLERQSQGPELYTEAGLLSAMERLCDNTDIAAKTEVNRGVGLGTAATRAGIIENLLERGYIRRKGKILVPTDKGQNVYAIVAGKKIASPTMTLEWENALADIEEGLLSSEDFHKEMENYTTAVTSELLQVTIAGESIPELRCPKCRERPLEITDTVIRCNSERCDWLQYRKVCGVTLSLCEIENLIAKGRTNVLKGMRSRVGSSFNARLVLEDQSKVSFVFEK